MSIDNLENIDNYIEFPNIIIEYITLNSGLAGKDYDIVLYRA